ncbi:hypothetical protein [Sphingomonas sp. LT1P40]|uniref:hypothetical protein n=1 Tax=Alteristakelama amylovorans TaxID=3096166 RepID=UPI002FCACBEC
MIPQMFNDAAVAAALPLDRLIDYMESGLTIPINAPLRMAIGGDHGRELLIMPAVSDRFAGIKMLTVVPANTIENRPINGGLFALFDATTGAALATMDAGELTARRTAAVSAIASRRLARSDAATLLLLGTGHIAPYLAEAHAAVLPLESIAIWGRRGDRTAACVEAVKSRLPGLHIQGVDDLEPAMRNADVVTAATRSRDPLIRGEWLREGTHVDLVGGYRPDMREIDDVGMLRGSIYVDTREGVLAEAGDLRSPIERGVIDPSAILGDLAVLLGGAGRVDAREITVFKSVGSAMSDLIAAQMVWETAGG